MGSLKISLRAGERLFLNGAVLRVDKRTQLELMNDATFLLESHVMQAGETRTPLRQLYFIVQMMLIEPSRAQDAQRVFETTLALLMRAFANQQIREGLTDIRDLVAADEPFEALKRLRSLIPIEDAVIEGHAVRPVEPAILNAAPAAAGAAR